MRSPNFMYNVFDRSRSMLDFPEIATLSPIGVLCEPMTINELCANSVEYIINKAQSKKIVIAWSGGIDSTLVLSELLKRVPTSQLTVMLNNNSILEYPEFYKKYIENKIDITPMNFYNDDNIVACLKDGVFVT